MTLAPRLFCKRNGRTLDRRPASLRTRNDPLGPARSKSTAKIRNGEKFANSSEFCQTRPSPVALQSPESHTRRVLLHLVGFFSTLETRVRRGWDSNPRGTFIPAGFQDRCLQPLGHPSNGGLKDLSYSRLRRDYMSHWRRRGRNCSSRFAFPLDAPRNCIA